ncbi:MAG: hypothetical protein ACK5XL_18120, partial [Cyclobacteriaceae bacterium]
MKLSICIFTGIASLLLAACSSDETKTNKITINGLVNEVKITEKDGFRIIQSNGIPDHEVGVFPNAYNPITIIEVDHTFKMLL